MPEIRRMGESFARDRKLTCEEAQQIVDQALSRGVVSATERGEVQDLLTRYRDRFEPGAAELLQALLEAPPAPPIPSETLALAPRGAARPVFLAPSGSFVSTLAAGEPANPVDLGDGLFRAAELVGEAKANPLANLSVQMRGRVFDQLGAALALVPAGVERAPGLDATQTSQLRSCAATVLLALADAGAEPGVDPTEEGPAGPYPVDEEPEPTLEPSSGPEAELRHKALAAYVGLARAETVRPLRESMVFNLHRSQLARSGEAKQASDALMRELAPLYPPYEQWFAGGNTTVNLEWTVGEGQFWRGFTNSLKQDGFKPVGAEDEHGVTTYEKTVDKPGVGPTPFRLTVRTGAQAMMAPAGDKRVQVFGYEGHSRWGQNIREAVRAAPPSADGGAGQLFFYNLCVGKGGLAEVQEKFPDLQVVTTFASSSFKGDEAGNMTASEGVQALLALVEGIAARAPWTTLHRTMNAGANINWMRGFDNFVTPVSTMVRAKVLDRDHDGQADYLDKLFNFNAFHVAEDSRRELTPLRQERPAQALDGTKVLVAANMVNTISEFSGILSRANRDSRVYPQGWFDPKETDPEIVKFDSVRHEDATFDFHMKVSARYAHASEEMLRAVTVYELNRYLANTHHTRLDPVDAKINGLLLASLSIDIDGAGRDDELWSTFLKKYGFPAIERQTFQAALEDEHPLYAGSPQVIAKLRAALDPALLETLKQPTVGQPTG